MCGIAAAAKTPSFNSLFIRLPGTDSVLRALCVLGLRGLASEHRWGPSVLASLSPLSSVRSFGNAPFGVPVSCNTLS